MTAPTELSPAVEVITLGTVLDSYIEIRSDARPLTVMNFNVVKAIAFFKAAKPLNSITIGDAEEFRLYLAPDQSKRWR